MNLPKALELGFFAMLGVIGGSLATCSGAWGVSAEGHGDLQDSSDSIDDPSGHGEVAIHATEVFDVVEVLDRYTVQEIRELASAAEDLLLRELEQAHQVCLDAGHAEFVGGEVPVGTGSGFLFEAIHHIPGAGFYVTCLDAGEFSNLYRLRDCVRAMNASATCREGELMGLGGSEGGR